MDMKKGQISGLPLVLIFALIVGALILFWGVKTVMDLNEQADYVQLADKITDLETDIDIFDNYGDGATKKFLIDIPSKLDYLCVTNSNPTNCLLDNEPCPTELAEYLDMIVVESKNVYIYPPEFDITYFDIENLEPKTGNPECFSNQATTILEKTGDIVTLSYYEK
jgi:hypothetical protein